MIKYPKFTDSIGSGNVTEIPTEIRKFYLNFVKIPTNLKKVGAGENVTPTHLPVNTSSQRVCWTNGQYAPRRYLEISGILELVLDDDLEDCVLKVFSRSRK